jgi:hypothetical protein
MLLVAKFNILGSEIPKRLLKSVEILAEQDLLCYKINDMTYALHVALASVNK